VSCIHLSFANFALHSTPQTKIWQSEVWRFKQHYFRVRHIFIGTFFFSQWPILPPPKILTFPSESPCILFLPGIESRMVGRPARSVVTILTYPGS
jgi:hypothetical protein